jgi:hypothetical protein
MKKIIIPFEAGSFSHGAFSFATMLQKETPILLAGVFLPKVEYNQIFLFPTAFAAPAYVATSEDFDKETVEKNISDFKALCEKNNIENAVHRNLYDAALPQLARETRFADMMIIGSELFYTVGSDGPLEYLKDALRNTECPVVIVPEKFALPSQIILAYDGSASSVYAIKQFANLFPALCSLHTILVYAGDEKHTTPDAHLIGELLSCHFKDMAINKISGDEKKNFYNWLSGQANPLLVSGSFSRSGISELFNKSFIVDIIRQHKTPIFIAHQ